MAWAFSGFTCGSLERAVTEDSALKQACLSCHVKEKGELIGGGARQGCSEQEERWRVEELKSRWGK